MRPSTDSTVITSMETLPKVVDEFSVFRALDINVGPNCDDGIKHSRAIRVRNELHHLERSEHQVSLLLAEQRAGGSLVHVSVWGGGDHEDVAQSLGIGRMAEVAGVKKVKNIMTLDN